ncbi:MAG: two-component system, NtrC family, response regulator GlrR [Verrucomicrobiota bacterium]|jgi:DNA-binding NtrC family response regulator
MMRPRFWRAPGNEKESQHVSKIARAETGPGTERRLERVNATSAIAVAIVHAPGTEAMAGALEELLRETNQFTCARFEYRAESGLKPREPRDPDVVVAILEASPRENCEPLFAALGRAFPDRAIVATTTQPDAFDISAVLEMGASDFLLPPLRRGEVTTRLMRQARVTPRGEASIQEFKEKIGLKQIIGESPALVNALERVPRFARCDATVLISGESGTGKEIFARAIHYLSPRAGRPFIPINCGALPENLVESEIFGHKRGAFTGAAMDQPGLIHEAEGGTLFLDEIDGLSRAAQVKLLRFLQDGEYRAVGSQQIAHADIRVVAATNADFGALVRAGNFREDLFYRLNVLALTLPALRERRGDILLLAHHILDMQAALAEGPPKKLSLGALNRLLGHSWPGNVRELENILIRAIVLCDRDTIELRDLHLPDDGVAEENQSFQTTKSRVMLRFEHDFLQTTLRANHGNITRAARAVKKNRRAFWELLRKHGLLGDARRE